MCIHFLFQRQVFLQGIRRLVVYLVRVSTGFQEMKFYREKRPFWIGETTVDNYKRDAIQKNRFEFGKNWKLFLSLLNEERILEADKSLKQMLEISDLKGKSFLDIRSGSGLFSLAARRFGRRNPRVKKSLFL